VEREEDRLPRLGAVEMPAGRAEVRWRGGQQLQTAITPRLLSQMPLNFDTSQLKKFTTTLVFTRFLANTTIKV
jgi:hypothetical protein